MTEMVYGVATPVANDPILPRWWRNVDRWSLIAVVFLFFIGLLLAMASSPPLAESNQKSHFYYVYRQTFFGSVSLVIMVIISMLPIAFVRRISIAGFSLCVVALLLLPIFGTDYGKGAVRWYSLIGLSIQPSEFLKPCFVVFTGWMMKSAFDLTTMPGRLLSFFSAVIIAATLALQPDFGQASLVLGVWVVMYFVSGASIFLLVTVVLGIGLSGFFAYLNSEHVRERIDGFLVAEVNPLTQIGYATNAIMEGGYLGVGLGEGAVKWDLPDAHTDFIIAVAAEEYGLLLCLLIILIFMFVVSRSLLRLTRETAIFVRLSGVGIASLLAMQAIVNMGVAVRLLPAKGMTLPFISYGGSSLLAMGFMMGLLFAFTRNRPQNDFEDILGRGV
ncbi:MAG: putative peptidoglycan glycosyltransferase FtsW [Pseudomonadota bacterium]|nr:putative peptidoglycan glycosyltransferase FtsW [Pseudomonadota bacterium]